MIIRQFILVLLALALPVVSIQAAEKDVTFSFSGAARVGETYEHPLPEGMVFYLRPIADEKGWDIWINHVPQAPKIPFDGPAEPNLADITPFEKGPRVWEIRLDSIGKNKIQDRLYGDKRSFDFALHPNDVETIYAARQCGGLVPAERAKQCEAQRLNHQGLPTRRGFMTFMIKDVIDATSMTFDVSGHYALMGYEE